jgi:hypothetical protein
MRLGAQQPFGVTRCHYPANGFHSESFFVTSPWSPQKNKIEIGGAADAAFLGYYERFRKGARIAHGDIARVLIAKLWATNLLRMLPTYDRASTAAA